ncbi:hypothetical protein VPH35_101515 [Triticum aestivum]
MLTLTQASRSLFAKPKGEYAVVELQLELYLIDTFLCDIGPLLCDAIDRGLLKHLCLAILDEEAPWERSQPDEIKCTQDIDGFFRAYPSVFHCLTKLSLHSLVFDGLDIHHVLFDCCKQLKHLALSFCDVGHYCAPWKIDAPNSKLCVLEVDRCCFERIELISLPKLEEVSWHGWVSNCAPFSFGFVPSLEELGLSNLLLYDHHLLKLSELLHGGACIRTLTLDFKGNAIWVTREIKQLAYAFRKLRKLVILGIFVEFDLLWTTTFLEAAPSIEMLHIAVCEHACEFGDIESGTGNFAERTNPQWELVFRGSKNLLLREVHIAYFRPLEQQLTFIKAVLERAPNVQTFILNKDGERCSECDAMALDVPPSEEQDMVVRQVTDGISFSGKIIFQ